MPLTSSSTSYETPSSGSTLQSRETSTHTYSRMDTADLKEDFLAARKRMSIEDFFETIFGTELGWEKENEAKLIAITEDPKFKEALESYSQPTNGKESTRYQLFSDLFNLVIQRIEADDTLCGDMQRPALRACHSNNPSCVEDGAFLPKPDSDLIEVIEDVFQRRFGKNGKGVKDAPFFRADLLAFIEFSIRQAALKHNSTSSRAFPGSYKGEPVAHKSSATSGAGKTLLSCNSSVY